MKNEYFVSCSFGADSTATAILAIEKGEPLSALVYCEIMFDKEKSAEVPEHRDFIYNTAIPYFEQRGVKTIVLRAEKTAREGKEARIPPFWKEGVVQYKAGLQIAAAEQVPERTPRRSLL